MRIGRLSFVSRIEDAPTQKKFLKEVESGTPIKEAVKKVDPDDQDQPDPSRQRGSDVDPDEIEID